MTLTRDERYWAARHYTVVDRGAGWLVAISRRGRIAVRTTPGRAARRAAARVLLELDDAAAAAETLNEEGPLCHQGDLYLEEQPALDDLIDALDMAELDALAEAIDLEDTPF